MRSRLLVAAVGVPLLVIVLFFLPGICTTALMAALCALAAHELLYATGTCTKKSLAVVITAMAMAVFMIFWTAYSGSQLLLCAGLLLFMTVLFCEQLALHESLRYENACTALLAAIVIPLMLGSLVRLRLQQDGKLLVAVPFIVAFISDGGAYFVGRALGKHKLAPVVSPKKTIEGLVGGIVIGTLFMAVYALILQLGLHRSVNWLCAIACGVLGSGIDVLGDLAFSLIKRQAGIKDYGHLMPGHGGILDRFDSMVLVAPLCELLMALLPFIR